jgi:hypothetical protein
MNKLILPLVLILTLLIPSLAHASHSNLREQVRSNTEILNDTNPDRFKFNLTTESRLLPPSLRNDKVGLAAGYTFNMLEAGDSSQHMVYIKVYLDPYSFFKVKE